VRGFFCAPAPYPDQLPLRRTIVLHIFAEQMILAKTLGREENFSPDGFVSLRTQFFE
jgi:hypothetical protein